MLWHGVFQAEALQKEDSKGSIAAGCPSYPSLGPIGLKLLPPKQLVLLLLGASLLALILVMRGGDEDPQKYFAAPKPGLLVMHM